MINTNDFIDKLSMINPKYTGEIAELEKEYNCEISCSIEKHHQLQYTYYFEVDFGLEENFYAEIESGINNGTQVNSYQWGYNTKPNSKTIEVLKDIIFDEEKFNDWYTGRAERKNIVKQMAVSIFNNHKNELLKLDKEQNYDNYVTGGGTNKTDTYYKSKYKELSEKGVFWQYIYEDIEVDCNFI